MTISFESLLLTWIIVFIILMVFFVRLPKKTDLNYSLKRRVIVVSAIVIHVLLLLSLIFIFISAVLSAARGI